MKLIIGLGNPGKEYETTRHNIGFMVLDALLKQYQLDCTKEKFGGKYAETMIDGEKYLFLKPQLYINLSGEVIRKYMDFYKIAPEDILVIHDDLDTQIGTYKLKPQGSSGGHNGLKNIEAHLGTNRYPRLKIGISNNKNMDTKDYVLGHLNKGEQESISEIIHISLAIFEDYTIMDFNQLMNKYNKHV